MRRLNELDWITLVLLVIGGINWGLVGLFQFNLIDSIFGPGSAITRIIYTLVGISAIYYFISISNKYSYSGSGREATT